MNAFLHRVRVLSAERRLVECGLNSVWAVCVEYIEPRPGAGLVTGAEQRERQDCRALLNPEEFTKFCRLKSLRKQLAERAGVPLYLVFTNNDLREMVEDGLGHLQLARGGGNRPTPETNAPPTDHGLATPTLGRSVS